MDYSFHKSVIYSKERMVYEEVQSVLDGDRMLEQRYSHVVPFIRNIARLAQVIQKRRQSRGVDGWPRAVRQITA